MLLLPHRAIRWCVCIYTQHFVQPGTHLFSLFFSCFPFEASLSGQLFCKAYDLAHLAPNLSLLKSVLLVTWRCCSSAFALLGLSSRCERLTFVFFVFFLCVHTLSPSDLAEPASRSGLLIAGNLLEIRVLIWYRSVYWYWVWVVPAGLELDCLSRSHIFFFGIHSLIFYPFQPVPSNPG